MYYILFLLVLHDLYLMTYYLMYIISCHFIFPGLCIAMQLLVSFLYLYLAVIFLLPYSIPCVADPSRSLNSSLLLCLHLPYYNSDLSVTCFLLTHVYHLTCHNLARPYCYDMTYPDYCQSIVMFYYLWYITTLSCYLLKTKHDTPDLVIIMFTGILSCFYGTKCHTKHGGGHL